MDQAVTLIAESVAKAVGVAGVEAMAFRNILLSAWTPKAKELADHIEMGCFIYDTGEVRPERASGILALYRTALTSDFIEAVEPYIDDLVGEAWENGRKYILGNILRGVLKSENHFSKVDGRVSQKSDLEIVGKKDITQDVIENLSTITGSSKKNVQRTIKRWFRTTQGEYFDRYIVPETARLLSYAETQEGKIASIRSIGQNYKKFVEAEGYWSSVSEYDMETSKIFAQVQTMQEMQIQKYTIEAILDEKTCAVCEFMHGSTWDVSQAVEKMYEMLIAEAENAKEINPFPGRSTPKDYDTPEESPFNLPPYHPRCRCNIVSESSTVMVPANIQNLAPDIAPKPPSDRLLTGVFNNYIVRTDQKDIASYVSADLISTGAVRALTKAEYSRVKKAFNAIPYELRKWAKDNKVTYQMTALIDDAVPSRVIGDMIQINEKYLSTGMGTQVIEHELRHALLNKQVIAMNGGVRGAESMLDSIRAAKFRMPVHVNQMYRLNGGRGVVAASAAVDEYLAMIGDYYKSGMSFDDLVKALREAKFGIEVEKTLGSGSLSLVNSVRWSATEAKKAARMWWDWVDVDNYTLLSKKQLMAKLTHKPSTALVQKIAEENEVRLKNIFTASGIKKVAQLGDNEPYDVWVGGDAALWYRKGAKKYAPKHVIEIKTIVRAKNDKITMHKESLARKKLELKKFPSAKAHTVVFDERTGKIYYRSGLGSFRLSTMQEVSEAELQKLFGGKVKVVQAAKAPALEFNQIQNKRQFRTFVEQMEKVKPEHRDYLTWYTWEQYKKKGTKLYLAADGSAGYGIDPDGTLISLFSTADSHGAGRLAIEDALARGAARLECFDGKLPKIYGEYGFKTVERYPWNPEFAPKNWDYKNLGEPDFVVMKKGVEGRLTLNAPGDEGDFYWGWKDQPMNASLAKVNSEFRKMTQHFDQDIKFEFMPTIEEILPFTKQQKIKVMNELANEMVRMQNKYPNMGDMWLYKGGLRLERINITPDVDVQDLFINGRRVAKADGNAAAQYWTTVFDKATGRDYEGVIQLAIDPDFTNQLNGSGKKMKGLFHGRITLGDQFSVRSATSGNIGRALAVFDHEMGHAVYSSMVDDYQYSKAITSFNNFFRKNKKMFRKVSKYATTNSHEAFAESFAAFVHPDYATAKKKLPPKIHKFFDELLNGKPIQLQASKEVEKISQYPIVRTSNIVSKEALDEASGKGINESYIIMIKETPKGKPQKYLFKPVSGEAWTAIDAAESFEKDFYDKFGARAFERDYGYDPLELIRKTIPEGTGATLTQRELLAYEISKKMDLSFVDLAETRAVYDEAGELTGVAVKWNDNAIGDWIFKRGKPLRQEETFDTVIFDYLIGNTDRHGKNWMRQRGTERLLLIDHGYSFPDSDVAKTLSAVEEFRSVPLGRLDDLKTPLDYLVDDEYKDRIVRNLLDLDIGDLASRYNLSYGQELALIRRRDELVLMIRESMLDDYFQPFGKKARFRSGYAEFDTDMLPEEINIEVYMDMEDISGQIARE